jgi:hypothetical protein
MSNRMTVGRFWAKVAKSDGCWIWAAQADKDGYGKLTWGGVSSRAHRVAWELTHGAIPEGLFVLHHCDNMRDASAKARLPNQAKTHCPEGHEYTPENTRTERNAKGWTMRSCVQCDRVYYKTWYTKNRAKKIASGVEQKRAQRARDPEAFRIRQRDHMRACRARKKAAASHSSQSSE